jgi:hypothetical protein
MTPKDRLKRAQELLGLPAYRLADELKITPEWLSKIYRNKATVSDDIGLRLDALLRNRGIDPSSIEQSSISPAEESPGDYAILRDKEAHNLPGSKIRISPMVDPRFATKRLPSTRQDCENYFAELMKRAAASDNPNAFPAIMDRLMKKFPLDEWDEIEP